MGFKKLMLLILVLFNFTFLASFANNLHSDESNSPIASYRDGVKSQRKFSHVGARGGGGGVSAGEGGNGNGGQANNSPRGGAAIPVYAAGSGAAAANRNNHHKNDGVCDRYGNKGLMIFIATTLTALSLQMSA